MFKYVRTINSHISAPEICYITGGYSSVIYENTVYTVGDNGNLEPVLTEGRTRYITLENKPSGVERGVKCIRVMPGMVFETNGNSDPQYYKVGLRGTAGESTGGSLGNFTECGNDLEIVDHHYCENEETVLVAFI